MQISLRREKEREREEGAKWTGTERSNYTICYIDGRSSPPFIITPRGIIPLAPKRLRVRRGPRDSEIFTRTRARAGCSYMKATVRGKLHRYATAASRKSGTLTSDSAEERSRARRRSKAAKRRRCDNWNRHPVASHRRVSPKPWRRRVPPFADALRTARNERQGFILSTLVLDCVHASALFALRRGWRS